MFTVMFSESNSGGYYRLSDAEWQALRDAGWHHVYDGTGYYVRRAFLDVTNRRIERTALAHARRSWEEATGRDSRISGCECCGYPFRFEVEDEPEIFWSDEVDD